MNFLNVGPLELMLVLVVALIVFGPQRLPEIGATVGRAIREFQRAQQEIVQEFTRELEVESKRSVAGPTIRPSRQPSNAAPASTWAYDQEPSQADSSPEQAPEPQVLDAGTKGEKGLAG
ncbi:MAG: Sec-independent protein translocase subunit TatA/TatB [Chloroflexota bacterium]|mgnify:CR=1 FL=1